MKIGVPSGIGDISWLVSKLVTSKEWPDIEFLIADGWPYRAAPYIEMLGKKCEYGELHFDSIVMFEHINPYETWEDVLSYKAGVFHMQPNHHLEQGKPLASYLPDLDTDYYYHLGLPNISETGYANKIMSRGPWIGLSAASYRGHKAWNTWSMDLWEELVNRLHDIGLNICFLGGSWDDLTRSLAYKFGDDLNLVGVTSFPEACALHNLLDFYIGFSSGLGILRIVMKRPTVMLWPSHQVALSESWANPQDIASGRYIPSQYMYPKDVCSLISGQMDKYGRVV